MAAENIRGDTPKQSPPVVENEQFSDIILILDIMELLLQAVTKLNKKGRYKSVPAKEENRNSFLKLDRYANMFESFVKNLWSQLKDPTSFGLLSVKEQALDDPKVRQAIEDLAARKKTNAVAEFLAKYDITPKGQEQSINNQNDKEMAKQEQTTQAQTAQDGQPKYRFNESMIDWEQLKHFGLSREYLQERGLLDSMLKRLQDQPGCPHYHELRLRRTTHGCPSLVPAIHARPSGAGHTRHTPAARPRKAVLRAYLLRGGQEEPA